MSNEAPSSRDQVTLAVEARKRIQIYTTISDPQAGLPADLLNQVSELMGVDFKSLTREEASTMVSEISAAISAIEGYQARRKQSRQASK